MTTPLFVPPFADPQLRKFALQLVQRLGGGTGTSSTIRTGNGAPTGTAENGTGYFDVVSNNFYIFDPNGWTLVNEVTNISASPAESVITSRIISGSNQWAAGQFQDIVCTTTYSVTAATTNTVRVVADIYGALTVPNKPTPTDGTSITYIGEGTADLQVIFSNKGGTARATVRAGSATFASAGELSYDFQYLALMFADSLTPTQIYTDPTNHRYVGIQNRPTRTSTNVPTDYTWFDAGSVLTSSNRLYATVKADRIVQFAVGQNNPDLALYQDIFTPFTDPLNPMVDYIDLDARLGSIVTGGYNVAGAYRTNPNENALGELAFNLPQLLDFGGNASQTVPLTGTGAISSITIDQQGRISTFQQVDGFAVGVEILTTPTSGTTFNFSHVVGQALFFLNGIMLLAADFTETATTVNVPAFRTGMVLVGWRFTRASASTGTALIPFTRAEFTTLANTTTYIIPNFVEGSDLVFVNGVMYESASYDYRASNDGITFRQGFIPPTGAMVVAISFNKLNGAAIPFNQNGYDQALQGTTVIPIGIPMRTPPFTPLMRNGVNLIPTLTGGPTQDYTILNNATSVVLTNPTIVNNEIFEATTFNYASNTPALLTAGGASGTSGITLLSKGSADPSKDSKFDLIKPPPTVSELIDEVKADYQSQIDDLKAMIRTLQGGLR